MPIKPEPKSPNAKGLIHALRTGHSVYCGGARAECIDCGKIWTDAEYESLLPKGFERLEKEEIDNGTENDAP